MNGTLQTIGRLAAGIALAALVLIGFGARFAEASNPTSNFASKSEFRSICQDSVKGEVVETKDAKGNTTSLGCYEKSGAATVCGGNAKDCTYFPPPPRQQPTGPRDPHVVTPGKATLGEDSTVQSPLNDSHVVPTEGKIISDRGSGGVLMPAAIAGSAVRTQDAPPTATQIPVPADDQGIVTIDDPAPATTQILVPARDQGIVTIDDPVPAPADDEELRTADDADPSTENLGSVAIDDEQP
jgi:hypothetical protein